MPFWPNSKKPVVSNAPVKPNPPTNGHGKPTFSAPVAHGGLRRNPIAVAFDPAQRLLAVASKNGNIQVFGKEGVSWTWDHPDLVSISQLIFLPNKGHLASVCPPSSMYLWNITGEAPLLAQELTLKHEQISVVHVPNGSEWMYVGTEKGNVIFLRAIDFVRSNYDIMWNKACCGNYKERLGAVKLIQQNPHSAEKLLLGYENGHLVLWNLVEKAPIINYDTSSVKDLNCASWHPSGNYFFTGHESGIVRKWICDRRNYEEKDEDFSFCEPVTKLKCSNGKKPVCIYNGGPTPLEPGVYCIHLLKQGTLQTLRFENPIIDFEFTVSPDKSEQESSDAIFVLFEGSIQTISISDSTFGQRIVNRNGLETQISNILCTAIIGACPAEFVSAIERTGQHTLHSGGLWPANGGFITPHPGPIQRTRVLTVTGHADGLIRFWESRTSFRLLMIFNLKEQVDLPGNPHILHIELCPYKRTLIVTLDVGFVVHCEFSVTREMVAVKVVDCDFHVSEGAREPETGEKAPVNASAVQKLVKLGFSEERCIAALKEACGDVNIATAQLFEQDLSIKDSEQSNESPDLQLPKVTPQTRPSVVLQGGKELQEESRSEAPSPVSVAEDEKTNEPAEQTSMKPDIPCKQQPEKIVMSGFQVKTVFKNIRVMKHGSEERRSAIEYVGVTSYLSAWDALAFANDIGVCVVSLKSPMSPLCLSLGQLHLMRKNKFSGRIPGAAEATEELITTLAIGTSSFNALDTTEAVWIGTSLGNIFAVSLQGRKVPELSIATAEIACCPLPALPSGPVTSFSFLYRAKGKSQRFAPVIEIPVPTRPPPPRPTPPTRPPLPGATKKPDPSTCADGREFNMFAEKISKCKNQGDLNLTKETLREATTSGHCEMSELQKATLFQEIEQRMLQLPEENSMDAVKPMRVRSEDSDHNSASSEVSPTYSGAKDGVPELDVIVASGQDLITFVNNRKKKISSCKGKVGSIEIVELHDEAGNGMECLVVIEMEGLVQLRNLKTLEKIAERKIFAQGGYRVAKCAKASSDGTLVNISKDNRVMVHRVELAAPVPMSENNYKECRMHNPEIPDSAVGGAFQGKKTALGGFLNMFGKGQESSKAGYSEHDRDELFSKTMDDRDDTAFLKRNTGEGGKNAMAERLKQRLDERTKKLAEQEERSKEMANHAEEFGDAATELANYYKNKKWWQL
eukprot:m.107341 g.107341  ORF g.107341 m.107341 type:complete len:1195 (-) comp13925_c0_seq1:2739-6323(-)